MKIVVVGLGYVGLPLAVQLAKHFECIGLDSNAGRIAELREGHDRTGEVDAAALAACGLALTSDAADGQGADLYIVTVPTPIDADNRPDLSPVRSATRTVAGLIDAAITPTIVYESTVYPGVTEDICGPMIEELSGLTRGRDFFLGSSKITKPRAYDRPCVELLNHALFESVGLLRERQGFDGADGSGSG